MNPILVSGGTGTIGRQVVSQLLARGVRVRALARNPPAAGLPPDVEVVRGDLTLPETLDGGLDGIDAAFLVWIAPPAAVERIVKRAERIVFLSAPIKTPHPFFQQPNPPRVMMQQIERLIESSGRHAAAEYVLTGPESLSQLEQVSSIGRALGRSLRVVEISPDEARRELISIGPLPAVNMLLTAWAAALGQPALVTSTFSEITGTAPHSFLDWVGDNAAGFRA